MAGQKILLIEDEVKISRFLELELVHENYLVEKAFDGRTGLQKALDGYYDRCHVARAQWNGGFKTFASNFRNSCNYAYSKG